MVVSVVEEVTVLEATDDDAVEHAPVELRGPAPDRDTEFTAFVGEAVPALARTAWLLCGDAHRAEELVQQALVRTYLAWPTARHGEPLAYARRVLANQRIDTWRARRREVLTSPDQLPDRPAPGHDGDHARYGELVQALRRLPARRRRVVVLRYVVGLSEKQTAQDLGISVGAVKSASSRGLAQLREALGASAAMPGDQRGEDR